MRIDFMAKKVETMVLDQHRERQESEENLTVGPIFKLRQKKLMTKPLERAITLILKSSHTPVFWLRIACLIQRRPNTQDPPTSVFGLSL
jgi:hypothetical protein